VVSSSAMAFQSWKTSAVDTRVKLCQAFIQQLKDKQQQIATDITNQMGKPLKQAIGEVNTCISRAQALIDMVDHLKDQVLPAPSGFMKKIVREPIGVVLCLVPWNYPLLCAVNCVVASVLCGNSVVLKHSDRSPLCANHFSQAFRDAGAPPSLVSSLQVDHQVVQRVIGLKDIAYVSFTGSVEGGRKVHQQVSERFIDVGLELGGKDPAYVCDDADLKYAIENVVDGAMYNAGQSCCSVERVYVDKLVYKEFVECAVKTVSSYVLGDPMDAKTGMGPLAQPKQPEKLAARVKEAEKQGAHVLIGGRATVDSQGLGRFFSPTVITNCTHQMDIMNEENFGPILAITSVSSDQEAINMMNDSKFGLTASVWTRNKERAERICKQLDSGTVFMNRCDFLDPYLPWSGRKDSGKGISLSHLAFNSLTRTKAFNFRLTT